MKGDMMKLAIIGDIHGCHKQLIELLEKLPDDIARVYSVGDLIDRGPGSKQVVQEMIDRKVRCVRGNHEDMCIDYAMGIGEYDDGLFLMNGGNATLESYNGKITDDHLRFMIDMPYFIETDNFILTHAGINSLIKDNFRDGSDSSKTQAMWHRGNISGNLGKVQVFGHTPQGDVHFIRRGGEVDGINIDTACFFSGKLSAIILPSMEIVQVENTL